MISFCLLVFIALGNCEVTQNAVKTTTSASTSRTNQGIDVSMSNATRDSIQSNASRKNFPLSNTDSELVMKSYGDDNIEMDGVVLALSMKKFKGGAPRWYTQWKNKAKTLFDGISQRRSSKQIRFRGQDPSVTIDFKAEAIVPALKELLSSKQVQKVLNNLASKAAIVYRSFQEDYVKEKKT